MYGTDSLVLGGDVLVISINGFEFDRFSISAGQVSKQVQLMPGSVGEGLNLITAQIVRGDVTVNSNELRYTLDTTAPSAPGVFGIEGLSDNKMSAADVDGTFIRVTLPDDAARGDEVKLRLGGSEFSSAKVGVGQLSDGYVDIFVSAARLGSLGSKDFSAIVVDSVGNESPGEGDNSLRGCPRYLVQMLPNPLS